MFFVGIELAWTKNNHLGIAILKENKRYVKLISFKLCLSNSQIINYIKQNVKNLPAIIAVDAPLIVPNENGRRVAEDLVDYLFRDFQPLAYPVNRKFLLRTYKCIRGEEL